MNTFIAGKIGEVLAFARIGKDTLAKGEKGFLKILDEVKLGELNAHFADIEKHVEAIASQNAILETVESGARETFDKVSRMRDTYIDGKWDESSEVLEWMGFYTGAALVHWYLVHGAALSLGESDLADIGEDAIQLYTGLFSADETFLEGIGKRASEA